MTAEIEVCAICAWRATCQKKFSISGKSVRCPDFVRDVSLKEPSEKEKKQEEEDKR